MVSREVERNGGIIKYRAATDDQTAWDRSMRPKVCKLAQRAKLVKTVAK